MQFSRTPPRRPPKAPPGTRPPPGDSAYLAAIRAARSTSPGRKARTPAKAPTINNSTQGRRIASRSAQHHSNTVGVGPSHDASMSRPGGRRYPHRRRRATPSSSTRPLEPRRLAGLSPGPPSRLDARKAVPNVFGTLLGGNPGRKLEDQFGDRAKNWPYYWPFVRAPGRTRTCDPRIRNPTLYPTELRRLDVSISTVWRSSPRYAGWVGTEGARSGPRGKRP